MVRINNAPQRLLAIIVAAALVSLGFMATAQAQDPDTSMTLTGVSYPIGVAVDSSGYVYVTQAHGTTVSVFAPGSTTADPALQLSGLNGPRAVAIGPDGNVYVANGYDTHLQVFNLATSRSVPIRTLTMSDTGAGVAVDSTGIVYASTYASTTVDVFDPGATTPNPAKTLTGLTRAGSLGIDTNDNIYVCDGAFDNSSILFYPNGATTPDRSKTLTGFTNAKAVAVSSAGQVYVSGGSSVSVFNPDQTTPDPALTLEGFWDPVGIGIKSDGTVYVGNEPQTGADMVLVFPTATPDPPSFTCTSGTDKYVVPPWTNQLNVTLRGAQGGGAPGGRGGSVSSNIQVEPGSTIQVNVGCAGKPNTGGSAGAGGFNGGANAGNRNTSAGAHLGAFTGGGGASDIRVGDCAATETCGLGSRVLVAGGGGGGETRGTKTFKGGAGGRTAGAGSKDGAIGVGHPGAGATGTAGGTGGAKAYLSGGTMGSAGSAGLGGQGGASAGASQSGPGAGGGAGLYGGGGGGSGNASTGSGIGGAGGGGTSGIGPAGGGIVSNPTYRDGAQAGDGSIDITPIAQPLAVTTTSLADGTTTAPYSQQLEATGGVPGYLWEVTVGTLPAGLALAPGGAITGTPTGPNGTSSFTVKVTDSVGTTSTKALSIVIDAGIAIVTSPPLPDGSNGVAYSQTLTATGATATAWSITAGRLPDGLTLNAGTGVISGTPAVADTFSFTVHVVGVSPTSSADAPFSINITDALAVATTSPIPTGVVGTAYSLDMAATGGIGPYTSWAITAGTLPGGLTLNPTTGSITGTPLASGTATFTVQVTDSLGTTASAPLTVTINPTLAITTTSLPDGAATSSYSQTLAGSGGIGPNSWSVSVGALPEGLNLQQSTGVISGTPAATGSTTFTVQVTDSIGGIATQSLTITVATAPPSAAQSQAPSSYPVRLRNRGSTLVNHRGALTIQGQPMSARITGAMRDGLNPRGDRACMRVRRGPKRKATVIMTGLCAMRVTVTYTAPGNSVYADYSRTFVYITRPVR